MSTHVVIMAGGVGSRLWPASTPEHPKQFLDLLGVGKSMIRLTAERFLSVCPLPNMWVVTSASYADIVAKQLPEIPKDQILLEPVARNTAPCIAYACWKIRRRDLDANVIVTPADALVLDKERFSMIIGKALEHSYANGSIVTIGIPSVRPETGYGYICAESATTGEVIKVEAFKEKPDLHTAEEYLKAGNYFWNAGIFIWKVSTITEQIRKYAPSIASVMDSLEPAMDTAGEAEALRQLFPTCEKISIDYAVMEKSDIIYTVAADIGWSDLGSWSSVGSHLKSDEAGNSSVSGKELRLFGCENCIVHCPDTDSVVISSLKDYIVAAGGGNILVCPVSQEQQIKEFTAGLVK